jgi:hypothetical protein
MTERAKMLERYRPYPKQLEFHNAGKTHREIIMLMAPNQSGKTRAASAEVAYHPTAVVSGMVEWQAFRSAGRGTGCF